MSEEGGADKSLFSLSLSTDRDKFLRRTCPACGMDFKTDVDEADLAWEVAPQFKRMGVEIGEGRETDAAEEKSHRLHCPYCGHGSDANETLTEETTSYLHRHILREVVLPMTRQIFSGLDGLGQRSGGLLSIRIEHSRSIYPPRPIHGPELPDMTIIEFICCGRKAKIADDWAGVDQCVFCNTPVAIR